MTIPMIFQMSKYDLFSKVCLFLLIISSVSIQTNVISTPDNTTHQNPPSLNFFRGETSDFNIDIYFVGTGSVSQEEILPVNSIYRVKSNFAFTPITIKANITGYTNWNLGNITLTVAGIEGMITNETDFGNHTTTFGQLFLFVDDSIRVVTGSELHIFGISAIIPQGDHTVSLLYIGKDEEKGIIYDYKSITIQIRKENEEFEEYITRDLPLDLNIEDQYEEGVISGEVIMWSSESNISQPIANVADKRIIFEPTIETSFSFDNGTEQTILNQMGLFLLNETGDKISITGTVNTTGFDGMQPLQKWNKSKGISFLLDAAGLHEIEDQMVKEVTIRQGINFLGIIAIAPYGLLHKDIPCWYFYQPRSDEYLCTTPIDWEYSRDNVDAVNASGHTIIAMDSSFDFLATLQGVFFQATIGDAIFITETEESAGFLVTTGLFSFLLIWIVIVRSNRRPNRKNELFSRKYE